MLAGYSEKHANLAPNTEMLREDSTSGRYCWKFGVILLAWFFTGGENFIACHSVHVEVVLPCLHIDAQHIPYGDIKLICGDLYKTDQVHLRGQVRVYQPELQQYVAV